jgi:uncharacterized protein (TIGR02996 family)
MASVLALISKAIFEKSGKLATGHRPRMDRYLSAAKGLSPLLEGGSLVLVTVRPGERLWLCAILDEPAFEETMWRSAPSEIPLTDVTALLPSIKLASGKGIQAPEGKLGMSLQTPRVLAPEDVALLRAATGSAAASAPEPNETAKAPAARVPAAKPPTAKAPAAKAAPKAAPAPTPVEPPKPAPPTPRAQVAAAGTSDLYAAVVASPDDEDARRVLADALLDADDPHGEFIQVSCDAAALPILEPRRAELERRALELRRRGSLDFSRPLRAIPFFNTSTERGSRYAFDRGFPDRLRGSARELLPLVAQAVKVSPVRSLELREVRATDLRALAAMPELAQIRSLTIEAAESLGGALAELLASHSLRRVESLSLHASLGQEDLDALRSCEALSGLRSLTIRRSSGRDDAAPSVDRLLRDRAGALEALDLSHVAVDGDTLSALRSLTTLALNRVAFGVVGARAFAKDPPRGLRRLRLAAVEVGEGKGLSAIVGSGLPELRALELDGMVKGSFLGQVLDAMDLPSLTRLLIEASPFRAEGAKVIAARAAKLAKLTCLSVVGAGIKDDGMRSLAAMSLPALEVLDLGGNAIAELGFQALAEGPLIRTVRELGIRKNKCENAGGFALARAPLGELRKLWLFYNWMGVKAVRALLAATPKLEELYAGENNYNTAPLDFVTASKDIRLRVFDGQSGNLEAFATSPAAQRIESISLTQSTVSSEAARALAALPMLEDVHLAFVTAEAEAMKTLRARFGPNFTTW